MSNTTEESPDLDQSPATASPRRTVTLAIPSGRGLVRVVATLLVLLLVATVVVEAVRLHDLSHDRSRLRSQLKTINGQAPQGGPAATGLSLLERGAITAATEYAIDFATYNYKNFDAQLALTESHSVDPFLTQYKNEAAPLRADIIRVKSVSTAKVISAGIATISPSRAVVDLFLDQTISNSASPTPKVEPQRVEMTLARRGGRWLISKVLLP
jgi:hypothetical protein